jgi:membrane fusion protein (multidrug efflux system)
MKTLKSKILLSIVLALLIPSLIQAAESTDKGEKSTKRAAPKADVFIVETPKDLPITLKYPAEIKSFKNVKVVSRVLGVLEEKYFTEGHRVEKGDVLYKIEDNVYSAVVDAAKASVTMGEVSLNNATRNWERTKKLYSSKAVSQEKRDSSLSAYEEAGAALSLAKAQLRQAQINLNFTKVKAPISGIIGLKQVDVGDFVASNPPETLVEITQNDKVYVDFSMPMSDYINIKNNLWLIPKDNKITASLEINNKLFENSGVIDFIDININKQTATVKMRAIFDNSNNYFMAGEFVRIIFNDIVQKNVITVPQKAVLQNPLGTIVFIEQKGHVEVRPVVLGDESSDKFVVLGGPLKSGDKVIVNNFFRLKPGGEVTVDKIINQQGK